MSPDSSLYPHYVLFIDDEEQSQKYFSQIFGKTFKVLLASDGDEGLKLFHEHKDEIGVVVSDQRMPGLSGSQLLAEVAKENPNVVNILSTAFSDLEAAIDAVNDGGIYRYVTKPWDLAELDVTLRRAMDYFQLKEQIRKLYESKIAGLGQMFHQSRLLAAIAIPALTSCGPSAVNAFRDLLRLSLSDDEVRRSSSSSISSLIDVNDRHERMEHFQVSMEGLIELAKEDTDESVKHHEGALSLLLKKNSPNHSRPLVTDSFLALLEDRAGEEELEHLAIVIAAYKKGLRIISNKGKWEVDSVPASESQSTVQELCSLFLDDSFLIGSVLHELSE